MRSQITCIVASAWFGVLVASRLTGIPTVPFESASDASYTISSIETIIVDSQFASARNEKGETLIPPTLHEFATTFADDLQSSLGIKVDVTLAIEPSPNSIFLTLGDEADYVDAAGVETSEGYSLSVSSAGITITGASPLGAFWGTRTILQQVILGDGTMPYGTTQDAPGWGIRGMALDAARHFYPESFIIEMCSYMSFFKQNTFQLHLSDNLNVNTNLYTTERSLELYARFRLWSDSNDVAGLNKYKNESYTREQFDNIQSACAARGVTVLSEIEAPGHALVIVQWKPELGLSTDLSLLNISHPETIPTMKTIWKTFLPWFHTKTVHIGADEYTAEVSEYNRFVNEMSVYINQESQKDIRTWGTFPPHPEYDNVYENVSVQHWEFFEDNPYYDYIMNKYSVLNSDDAYYVVNKWSASYPQKVNISRTFHGNPATRGLWYPNIFDQNNATNNPPKANPLVLGAVAPLWNDYGANASVYSEAYYAWKEGIPALADKQWGGDLAESEFPSVLSALHPYIPAQDLEKSIQSKTSTIFNYNFSSVKKNNTIADLSGNAYDASTTCKLATNGSLAISPSCSLKTPLGSKGRDYTLKLTLRVDELMANTDATLISGPDSALMLTPNITLFTEGNYYRLNSTIPLSTWVELSLIGRGTQTFARITPVESAVADVYPNGTAGVEEEFLTTIGVLGEFFVWASIAIEAPLSLIGGAGSGWEGELAMLSLSSEA
ncbi:glycoside hydrolase superfamily [Pseudomassariella vexata]|uniref:beta-N-acetylhexosaminidase n=1 Tax=Pseudomassariella vexata TaxID=1141098 RepID=A0A1Y2EAS2_9PEZI|nr:glycoside hydrolase superfamily [Pseudomassariella vexata]ORY68404.1 glycoside hydrolase superfamily [Pseudomassariella vexata]